MKKVLAVVLSVVLMLSIFPLGAFNAVAQAQAVNSGTCGESLTWSLDNNGTLTISGTGAMYDYSYSSKAPWGSNIKRVIIENGVTHIGNSAFESCLDLYDVSLGNTVGSIGVGAFSTCINLNHVAFPTSLTTIGQGAFNMCSLWRVYISANVTSIGTNAFGTQNDAYLDGIFVDQNNPNYSSDDFGVLFNKNKTELIKAPYQIEGSYVIPSSVTKIYSDAFVRCEYLTDITIPKSVKTIEVNSFDCRYLQNVFYLGSETDKANMQIGAVNSSLLNALWHYSSCIETASHTFVDDCDNTCSVCGFVREVSHQYADLYDKYCNLCDALRDKPTGTTGECTWTLDGTTLIISGNGAMEDYMWSCGPWGSGIKKVIIENGVTHIGNHAFNGCLDLSEVSLGNTVVSIGDGAFLTCVSLSAVSFPASLTTIGYEAFTMCDLSHIYIPANVTNISPQAFTLPNGYILSIEVDKNNPNYSSDNFGVFFNKDKTVLIQAPSVIENTYVIPSGVTAINTYAFLYCNNLTNITIPKSVTHIYSNAFECRYLENVFYLGSESDKENISIGQANSTLLNATWHYNSCIGLAEHLFDNVCDATCNRCDFTRDVSHQYTDLYDKYCNLCNTLRDKPTGTTGECTWTLDGTTLIISGNGAMEDYMWSCGPWGSGIKKVIIEDGVTHIGNYAFKTCLDLSEVSLGNTVGSIGEAAFLECINLYAISFPSSLTTIGYEAFKMCDLWRIYIPANVTNIAPEAFALPNGYIEFFAVDENNPNYSSDNLGVLYNKDKTVLIQAPNLIGDRYIIPSGVTAIYSYAFFRCDDLTDITLPKSVTLIEYNALDCVSLQNVFYLGTELHKENITIQGFNQRLLEATWHYNSCFGSTEHVFSDYCDDICNVCEKLRSAPHYYEWVVDIPNNCGENGIKHKECTACHEKQYENTVIYASGEHNYTLNGGYTCNVCKQSIAPAAPVIEIKTHNTVTLIATDGFEYSLDGTSWQSDNTFLNLLPETEYTFYQRVKGSNIALVSPSSAPVIVMTDPEPTYTIIFKDWDGRIISSNTYHYGDTVEVPPNPTRESDDEYIYSFIEWDKSVTVCLGDTVYSATYNQTKIAPTLLKIASLPTKTTYTEGTTLDDSGMVLTLHYNNGVSESVTGGWWIRYDFSTPGTSSVFVAYRGLTLTFDVTVVPKALVSIAIASTPQKTEYLEGDATLDTEGLLILAYYDNDTSEIIMGNYSVTGYSSTPGDKTITVTFQDKTATFTVTVKPKKVQSISITQNPTKLVYTQGDSIDTSGMVVTAHYNNNTSEIITDYTISGDTSTVGRNSIIVSYGGKSNWFVITVNVKIPSAITSSKYTVSGSFISKITCGTTVEELISGINESAYCKAYSGNTLLNGTSVIGTGMVVKILDSNTAKASYTSIVTGDTNGDGNITVTDMISIKAHVLKKSTLSGAYAAAADTNADNSISITDFIQIKAKILGKGDIVAR